MIYQHAAKVLADSVSPHGVRLTTFEVTFPRIVLAEFNTHRVFSRNSASSRAIPVEKLIQQVLENPYVPSSWGKNQKGMQASEELGWFEREEARIRWFKARDEAVYEARRLLELGVHKQLTNRLLEPFMWHTVIVTATEWINFFHLRNNPMAHPDIQIPARRMQALYESHTPKGIDFGEWHLPLISEQDKTEIAGWSDDYNDTLRKISVGRCARVSYLTHDGKRDYQADIDLHDKLLTSGHMSPFEHVARPVSAPSMRHHKRADGWYPFDRPEQPETPKQKPPEEQWFGNFRGWVQYRKTIPGEHDMLAPSGS